MVLSKSKRYCFSWWLSWSNSMLRTTAIDYINELLADRTTLLSRLEHARSSLPPGHPALASALLQPPWEREWKGGEGKTGEGDDDEEDEDSS